MNKSDIDLNAPAFGAGSQKLEDIGKEPSVEEQVVVEEEKEEVLDESVEENKVPYSRFKNVNEARRQAEEEADRWRQKAEQLESNRSSRSESTNEDMPDYWVRLYGDSEASQEAWNIQSMREQELERRAYEAGQRGAQELESVQRERINSNVELIDDSFDDLSAFVGRNLTDKEQSAILDIVDDYTAKDSDGNYQGAILPFDKAWEIYELKQNSGKSSQRKDRDSVAALSGTSSQGDTEVNSEQSKNWNPFEKGSWRKRL